MPKTRIVYGNPVDALNSVGADEQAQLLVVGSRGRSGIAAALSGSISTRLASSAHHPVLVVSAEAGARFAAREQPGGTVLGGVDGSTVSTRALSLAADLADRMGLTFLPVHAGGNGTAELPPDAVGTRVKTDLGDPVDVLRARALSHDALRAPADVRATSGSEAMSRRRPASTAG